MGSKNQRHVVGTAARAQTGAPTSKTRKFVFEFNAPIRILFGMLATKNIHTYTYTNICLLCTLLFVLIHASAISFVVVVVVVFTNSTV